MPRPCRKACYKKMQSQSRAGRASDKMKGPPGWRASVIRLRGTLFKGLSGAVLPPDLWYLSSMWNPVGWSIFDAEYLLFPLCAALASWTKYSTPERGFIVCCQKKNRRILHQLFYRKIRITSALPGGTSHSGGHTRAPCPFFPRQTRPLPTRGLRPIGL